MTDRDVIARSMIWPNSDSTADTEAGRILSALAAAGLVIVPKALTYEQSLAGLRAGGKTDTLREIYGAVISAAPAQETNVPLTRDASALLGEWLAVQFLSAAHEDLRTRTRELLDR